MIDVFLQSQLILPIFYIFFEFAIIVVLESWL